MTTAILEHLPQRSERPAKARNRLQLFDAARLAAAYAIVWLHTPRSAELEHWTRLGRFAVPFFSAAAVFFVIDGLRRQPNRTLRQYALNRFQRIYLPFLAWSGIYLIFKWVKSFALPEQANDFPRISALWTGTFFHLWFMPFVLLLTLAVFGIGRTAIRNQRREKFACAVSLLLGSAIAVFPTPRWIAADPSFLLLAWQTLPAACWGLALALVYSRSATRFISKMLVTLTAIILFAGLVAYLAEFGRSVMAENLAGIAFLVAALQPRSTKWMAGIARFGSLAYGIYLCHLLVIKTLESVTARLQLAVSWQLDLGIFFLAIVGSTLLAWALTRSSRTRWLAA